MAKRTAPKTRDADDTVVKLLRKLNKRNRKLLRRAGRDEKYMTLAQLVHLR